MPSEFVRHWTLDPAVTILNHGSYGAAPRQVLAAQQRGARDGRPTRAEIEAALRG
jgi:hypothetical protein